MQICQDNPFLLINRPPSWQWEYLMDPLIPKKFASTEYIYKFTFFHIPFYVNIHGFSYICRHKWMDTTAQIIDFPKKKVKKMSVPDSIIAQNTDFYPCEMIWFYNKLGNVFKILKILCWIFIHFVFMFGPIMAQETVRCRGPKSGHPAHRSDGQIQISWTNFVRNLVKFWKYDGQ